MFLLVLLASSYILTLKSVLPQSEGQFLILQGDGITAPLLLQVMGLREGFRASNSLVRLKIVQKKTTEEWICFLKFRHSTGDGALVSSWILSSIYLQLSCRGKEFLRKVFGKIRPQSQKGSKKIKNTINIIKCYKMMWNDINWFWHKMINVYIYICSAPPPGPTFFKYKTIYIYMLAPQKKTTVWITPIKVNWQRTYRHKCIF